MITTRFNLVKTLMLICLSVQVYAQKPQIQVTFDITEDTSIYIAFEDQIADVESRALSTLIKGLNNYIGFVDFTTKNRPNKLKFTLNEKIEATNSDAFFDEYWLFFELTKASSENPLAHQCKFLGINEIDDVLSTPDALLNKLEQVWTAYLKKAYNIELVNLLFNEVALVLPKKLPVIDNSGDKEAILPFKKEMLKMDPNKSTFKVVIEGMEAGGNTKKSTNDNAHFSRFIVKNMPVPDSLIGCILIELKGLPDMIPSGGEVYITNYRWEPYNKVTKEDNSEFDANN